MPQPLCYKDQSLKLGALKQNLASRLVYSEGRGATFLTKDFIVNTKNMISKNQMIANLVKQKEGLNNGFNAIQKQHTVTIGGVKYLEIIAVTVLPRNDPAYYARVLESVQKRLSESRK